MSIARAPSCSHYARVRATIPETRARAAFGLAHGQNQPTVDVAAPFLYHFLSRVAARDAPVA